MKKVIEIGSCQKHFSPNNGSTNDDVPSYLFIYLFIIVTIINLFSVFNSNLFLLVIDAT